LHGIVEITLLVRGNRKTGMLGFRLPKTG